MWELKSGPFPSAMRLRGFEEWLEEAVNFLRVAVVGVESDEDVVFLSEQVSGLGEDDGAKGFVCNGGAGGEAATTGGYLNNTIGSGLGKSFERTTDGSEGGDVNGGVCVTTFLGGVEHSGVLCWCCNWHDALEVAQPLRDGKVSPLSIGVHILFGFGHVT